MSRPQVSFYHLGSDQPQDIARFCCRLADKAWQLGHSVAILTRDGHQSRMLDDLLWTFRDEGFLPHALAEDDPEHSAPVRIAERLDGLGNADLLINLCPAISDELEAHEPRFSRIAEIIDENPQTKQQGRIRYSYYDKKNYPLEYHDITSG